MSFYSPVFLLLFLPIVIGVYFILPNIRSKNIWIIVSSFLFYAFGGLKFALLLLAFSFFNWFLGLLMCKLQNPLFRKTVFLLALLFDIGILCYFKYTNFIFLNSNLIFHTHLVSPSIIQPIGLSFITFQALSYQIDLYRKKILGSAKFSSIFLYLTMFPQIVSGPIVKYIDISDSIETRTVTLDKLSWGIRRFIIGFAKKTFIANTLGQAADNVFGSAGYGGAAIWLALVCYSLQLYFDFSGYSDMAIGVAKMLGFTFNENFNYPYISKSVREFWRRWHISLSTWFREYIYIPLGGNRKGNIRTGVNLLIVFLVTGLWHGANWTFLIWGIYHGAFLILERGKWGKILNRLPSAVQRMSTLTIVLFGWLIFRSTSILQAISYVKQMFDVPDFRPEQVLLFADRQLVIMLVLAILLSTPVFPFFKRKTLQYVEHKKYLTFITIHLYEMILFVIFIVCFAEMIGSTFNPFIYARF